MKTTTTGTAGHNFHALELSLELIRRLRPLVGRLRACDANLADQIVRAASSAAANLGEGNRRTGKDRTYRFRIAAGSADEVRVHLRVAVAWGWLSDEDVLESRETLDRLVAVTWRLTH